MAQTIPGLIEGAKKEVALGGALDSAGGMIRGGFLSPDQRAELLALLRDGHTEQRLARRANALLLLDDGWSCEKVAKALYLDDDKSEAGARPMTRMEWRACGASKAAAARATCRRSRKRG